jgi:hypothetical protein
MLQHPDAARTHSVSVTIVSRPLVRERLTALSSDQFVPLYSTIEKYHVSWQDGDFSQPASIRKENTTEFPAFAV